MDSIMNLLADRAKGKGHIIAVAAAEDEVVLSALENARQLGIAQSILCGDESKIREIAQKQGIALESYRIVHAEHPFEAAEKAVSLVANKEASALMKGNIKTGDLLKTVLREEFGLRTGRTMSMVAAFEITGYSRILILTDPGMVIAPTLEQKVEMIYNAIPVAKVFQIQNPKVAVVGAIEVVNPKMEATIHAALLAKMADRGQIKGVIVDGPFALDNVVSEEAARHKGIDSPVAGNADIILTPDIEAGNILYKALVFLAKARVATTILGAKVPIILTSRADSDRTKLDSIALNMLLSVEMGETS